MAVDRVFAALVRESPYLDEVIEATTGGREWRPGPSRGGVSREDRWPPFDLADRLPGDAPERPLDLRERSTEPGGPRSEAAGPPGGPAGTSRASDPARHAMRVLPTSPRRSVSTVEDLSPHLAISDEADRRCAARLAALGVPPRGSSSSIPSPAGPPRAGRGPLSGAGRPTRRATRRARPGPCWAREKKPASSRSDHPAVARPRRRRGRPAARGVPRALPPRPPDGDGRHRVRSPRRRPGCSRRRPVRPTWPERSGPWGPAIGLSSARVPRLTTRSGPTVEGRHIRAIDVDTGPSAVLEALAGRPPAPRSPARQLPRSPRPVASPCRPPRSARSSRSREFASATVAADRDPGLATGRIQSRPHRPGERADVARAPRPAIRPAPPATARATPSQRLVMAGTPIAHASRTTKLHES